MTILHDTMLTIVLRRARTLVLAWVLVGPTHDSSALNAPERPAATLSPRAATHRDSSPRYRGPRTYLAMIGPAALRFADAPSTLPPEPPLPKPFVPLGPPPEANLPAVTPHTPTTDTATPLPPEALRPEATPQNSAKPISILPDDLYREIRPEDVLPFFQFPGASSLENTGILSMPTTTSQPRGATAPPSSATYRLQ